MEMSKDGQNPSSYMQRQIEFVSFTDDSDYSLNYSTPESSWSTNHNSRSIFTAFAQRHYEINQRQCAYQYLNVPGNFEIQRPPNVQNIPQISSQPRRNFGPHPPENRFLSTLRRNDEENENQSPDNPRIRVRNVNAINSNYTHLLSNNDFFPKNIYGSYTRIDPNVRNEGSTEPNSAIEKITANNLEKYGILVKTELDSFQNNSDSTQSTEKDTLPSKNSQNSGNINKKENVESPTNANSEKSKGFNSSNVQENNSLKVPRSENNSNSSNRQINKSWDLKNQTSTTSKPSPVTKTKTPIEQKTGKVSQNENSKTSNINYNFPHIKFSKKSENPKNNGTQNSENKSSPVKNHTSTKNSFPTHNSTERKTTQVAQKSMTENKNLNTSHINRNNLLRENFPYKRSDNNVRNDRQNNESNNKSNHRNTTNTFSPVTAINNPIEQKKTQINKFALTNMTEDENLKLSNINNNNLSGGNFSHKRSDNNVRNDPQNNESNNKSNHRNTTNTFSPVTEINNPIEQKKTHINKFAQTNMTEDEYVKLSNINNNLSGENFPYMRSDNNVRNDRQNNESNNKSNHRNTTNTFSPVTEINNPIEQKETQINKFAQTNMTEDENLKLSNISNNNFSEGNSPYKRSDNNEIMNEPQSNELNKKSNHRNTTNTFSSILTMNTSVEQSNTTENENLRTSNTPPGRNFPFKKTENDRGMELKSVQKNDLNQNNMEENKIEECIKQKALIPELPSAKVADDCTEAKKKRTNQSPEPLSKKIDPKHTFEKTVHWEQNERENNFNLHKNSFNNNQSHSKSKILDSESELNKSKKFCTKENVITKPDVFPKSSTNTDKKSDCENSSSLKKENENQNPDQTNRDAEKITENSADNLDGSKQAASLKAVDFNTTIPIHTETTAQNQIPEIDIIYENLATFSGNYKTSEKEWLKNEVREQSTFTHNTSIDLLKLDKLKKFVESSSSSKDFKGNYDKKGTESNYHSKKRKNEDEFKNRRKIRKHSDIKKKNNHRETTSLVNLKSPIKSDINSSVTETKRKMENKKQEIGRDQHFIEEKRKRNSENSKYNLQSETKEIAKKQEKQSHSREEIKSGKTLSCKIKDKRRSHENNCKTPSVKENMETKKKSDSKEGPKSKNVHSKSPPKVVDEKKNEKCYCSSCQSLTSKCSLWLNLASEKIECLKCFEKRVLSSSVVDHRADTSKKDSLNEASNKKEKENIEEKMEVDEKKERTSVKDKKENSSVSSKKDKKDENKKLEIKKNKDEEKERAKPSTRRGPQKGTLDHKSLDLKRKKKILNLILKILNEGENVKKDDKEKNKKRSYEMNQMLLVQLLKENFDKGGFQF